MATGLWRLIAGTERPMVTLIAWRRPLARNAVPGTSRAGALARVSIIQAGLVLITVLAATGMARGNGAGGH